MKHVSLDQDSLFQLHQDAILVDSAFNVSAYGPLAQRYAPGMQRDRPFAEFFDIFPESGGNSAPEFTAEQFAAKRTALVLISKCRSIRLNATLVSADTGYLVIAKPAIADPANPANNFRIDDFAAGDPLIQCLLQIILLQGLRDEAEENAHELKVASEQVTDILLQMRRITGFMSHEFHNLLAIIQLNCDRIESSTTRSPEIARAIGLIKDTALRGGGVCKWLRAISGDANLWPNEPLDGFLRANLPLLQTLCGPNVSLTSCLMAGSVSIDGPVCDLLNCIVNLIRTIGTHSQGDVRADISTMLLDATPSKPALAKLQISIQAKHSCDGADLLLSRYRSFLGQTHGTSSIAQFAKAVGGSVHYEPQGQNRANFTLKIPCIAKQANLQEAHRSTKGGEVPMHPHVVVVEDEPAALEALVELLEFEGFAISACSNAEEALAAIAASPDAVLVTDVVLPDMDGLTLAQKATLSYPQVRVVIISGHVPDLANYNPQWAFLQKPFNINDLIAAILQPGE